MSKPIAGVGPVSRAFNPPLSRYINTFDTLPGTSAEKITVPGFPSSIRFLGYQIENPQEPHDLIHAVGSPFIRLLNNLGQKPDGNL